MNIETKISKYVSIIQFDFRDFEKQINKWKNKGINSLNDMINEIVKFHGSITYVSYKGLVCEMYINNNKKSNLKGKSISNVENIINKLNYFKGQFENNYNLKSDILDRIISNYMKLKKLFVLYENNVVKKTKKIELIMRYIKEIKKVKSLYKCEVFSEINKFIENISVSSEKKDNFIFLYCPIGSDERIIIESVEEFSCKKEEFFFNIHKMENAYINYMQYFGVSTSMSEKKFCILDNIYEKIKNI